MKLFTTIFTCLLDICFMTFKHTYYYYFTRTHGTYIHPSIHTGWSKKRGSRQVYAEHGIL